MRLLITGASGFLGREIVRQAAESGISVRTFSRAPYRDAAVESTMGDVTDIGALREAMEGIDVVIHAAGLAHIFSRTKSESAPFDLINHVGTRNAVAAACEMRVKRFVLISSISVYGFQDRHPVEEDAILAPASPYARSKRDAEVAAVDLAGRCGLELPILRVATLCGEEDPGNVARLIDAIARRRFVWIGRGTNRKSLVHRADAARAVLAAAVHASPVESRPYNVAGRSETMRGIVEGIRSSLGRKESRVHIPAGLIIAGARALKRMPLVGHRAADVEDTVRKWLRPDDYSGAAFQRDFDFRFEIDVAEAIRREVAWYLTSYPNRPS